MKGARLIVGIYFYVKINQRKKMEKWLNDYLDTGIFPNLADMSVEKLQEKNLEVICAIADLECEVATIATQLRIIRTGIDMLGASPNCHTLPVRMRILAKLLENAVCFEKAKAKLLTLVQVKSALEKTLSQLSVETEACQLLIELGVLD
jgi:hypothetical protein